MKVIGLDPSSRKLAFMVFDGETWNKMVFNLKQEDMRARCIEAAEVMSVVTIQIPDVVVYKEAPVVGNSRAAWAVIPQSMVAGALFLGLPDSTELIELNNKEWKSGIGVKGGGNAKKHEIIRFIRENYPEAYQLTLNTRGNPDQDLIDAAGICLYGMKIENLKARLRKKLRRRNGQAR